jgi:porin
MYKIFSTTGKLFSSATLIGGLLLCSGAAFAEEEETKEKPKGLLENGLISLTKTLPPVTKVFNYAGDISTRATMFGDSDGKRTDLYNKGITIDGTLTQVLQGVTSGGPRSDIDHSAHYNGLLEVNATFDTAKLGWWSGGVLMTTLMSSWGDPISSSAGNVSPVNMTPMWPVPFDNSTELTEYYLMQALPNDMLLLVGRLDATNYLDKNSFANNPESQFLNTMLNNNLLWGEFLTFSTYAGLLIKPVNKDLKLGFAVWDPETQPGDYGGVWDHYGVAITAIWDYEVKGLKGALSPVLAYTNKDALPGSNHMLAEFPLKDILLNIPPKKGNWMFTITGEQYLWTPEGSAFPTGENMKDYFLPTQDFVTNAPGVGIFYRFAYTPEDRNPWNIVASLGVGARGIIPGRPYDRMGIGWYGMYESGDFQDIPIVGEALGDESGFEAFYNFAITPWLQLSASAQYINQGLAGRDNAWALGTRLFLRF